MHRSFFSRDLLSSSLQLGTGNQWQPDTQLPRQPFYSQTELKHNRTKAKKSGLLNGANKTLSHPTSVNGEEFLFLDPSAVLRKQSRSKTEDDLTKRWQLDDDDDQVPASDTSTNKCNARPCNAQDNTDSVATSMLS
jgi:hypothetical protein